MLCSDIKHNYNMFTIDLFLTFIKIQGKKITTLPEIRSRNNEIMFEEKVCLEIRGICTYSITKIGSITLVISSKIFK